MTWERPSVNVRQRPLVNVPIVTQLVTRLSYRLDDATSGPPRSENLFRLWHPLAQGVDPNQHLGQLLLDMHYRLSQCLQAGQIDALLG